jgi:hypothetical protein
MLQIKSINSKINQTKCNKKAFHVFFPTLQIGNSTFIISKNLTKTYL